MPGIASNIFEEIKSRKKNEYHYDFNSDNYINLKQNHDVNKAIFCFYQVEFETTLWKCFRSACTAWTAIPESTFSAAGTSVRIVSMRRTLQVSTFENNVNTNVKC